MFFAPKPNQGFGAIGFPIENATPAPPPKTAGFWICIIAPNVFYLISLSLNSLCFGIMVIKSQCTFTTPLNLLMMVFLLTMAYYSLNNMVCSIVGEALGMTTGAAFMRLNQTGDIFASYYSILLIFLVGLNRCAVYTMPWMMKYFFQRKRLIIFLIALAIFMIWLSNCIYVTTGMARNMDSKGYFEDTVGDMTLMNIVGYGGYGLALSSCIFYVRIYFYLREQRNGVTHNKTKELLNKAENFNSRQGIFVLVVYSISLVLFILMNVVELGEDLELVLHAVQQIVQALPALAIPLALLCFCPEMQGVLLYILTGGKKGFKCKHHDMSWSNTHARRGTVSASNSKNISA